MARRVTDANEYHAHSSRSHALISLHLEKRTAHGAQWSLLHLVDLAGSERVKNSGVSGQGMKEAQNINKSLSALGSVMAKLQEKASFVPYRDSKLTRLLQDSLGGNTKTTMIANCGPADYNYDETLTTLRYANRAKNIKNKPKINEDPKDALLREYQDEITKLKEQLALLNQGGDI